MNSKAAANNIKIAVIIFNLRWDLQKKMIRRYLQGTVGSGIPHYKNEVNEFKHLFTFILNKLGIARPVFLGLPQV